MRKKSKIVIARILAILMVLSILPADYLGAASVVMAEELEENAEVNYEKTAEADYEETAEADYEETVEADYEETAETDYTETDSGIKVHNFTGADGSYNASSDFFTFKGKELSTKVEVDYTDVYGNALKLTKAFDIGGSSDGYTITFTTETTGKLIIVTNSDFKAKKLKLDNKSDISANADAVYVVPNLSVASHTIAKSNPNIPIYYIAFIPDGSSVEEGAGEGGGNTGGNETVVPKPTADPEAGEIEGETKVKLSATAGDAIYYTLDTSVELSATTGTEYQPGSDGISITPPATLRAIAVRTKDGEVKTSEIATFIYTVKLGDAPVATPVSGTAVEKGTEVTISATGAEAIKYTLDGSDPTGSGATNVDADSVKVTINEDVTIKAVAIRDGVAGKILEARYTIIAAAKPVASKTGRVEAGTEITISTSTAGAEIYYTMGADPADPTTSSELHGTGSVNVTITEATTIKAIAVKDKYKNSEVAVFNYTILDGSLMKTYVLDADAIYAQTGKTYSYKVPTVIDGTDGYFTAMANNNKGASLNKIEDMKNSKGAYYFSNLSWNGVDIGEKTYAVAITGGAMEVNNGTPKVVVSAIKFTTEAYATGVVYYSLKESTARTFKIQGGTDTSLGSTAHTADGGSNTKVLKTEFTLPTPGTYYVGFSGSGGIIPYMEVTEDYTIEPEKGPETIPTKTITVNDLTQTVIDADFNGDVSFVNASDSEASDAVNILLNVQSIGADNEALSTGIKKKVAEETEALRLESGVMPQTYYYDLSLADKDTNSGLLLDSGSIMFRVSYEKLGMTHNDTLVVLQDKYVIEESKITRDKKSGSFLVEADDFRSPFTFIVNKAGGVEPGEIEISDSYGYEEGAAAEWKDYTEAEFDGYAAYVSTTPTFPNNSKTQRIDNELIRKYNGYWRVDTVGLKKGTYYIKIDAVKVDSSNEPAEVVASNITGPLTVTNYDRSGFAFSQDSKWKTASGAYNDDGTLREGAQVIYVTAATAKTCTAMMHVNGENNAAVEVTGIQNILKEKESTKTSNDILDIRIIGLVTKNDMDALLSNEGLQVKGKNAGASGKAMNVTIEGIGEDATVKGFGFLIRNCGNVEFRNFAIMAFMDDGVSMDTDNENIWIHDLDIFYGSTGGDSDQAKGDGSVDIKGTTYVTVAYNHFWDSGKCSLCGMEKVTAPEFKVTYHHNWFDHSDSRHPRIRRGSVHIYNNYFDGNSKYGVGTTNNSNAFVEANYFRNVKYPMMISLQGTDATGDGTFSGEVGGMIKAYNNKIETPKSLIYANSTEGGATAPANAKQFDAYLASERDDPVPAEYVTASSGIKYNNFDTSYDLGVKPENIDNPGNVKAIVTAKAGRLNNGDFERNGGYPSLTGENADTDDTVDIKLKTAVVNYETSVVSIGGINGVATSASGSSSGTVIASSSVSAPVPSQPEGNYTSAVDITLSCEPANAEIYYTTDGSSPLKAANGTPYNGDPIHIDTSTVIKAIAILKEGGVPVDSSGIVKYVYTVTSGSTVTYTITVDKADNTAESSFTVRQGEDITKEILPNPVREGYIFKHWVDADGNVIKLPYEPKGNMKLTAVWIKDDSDNAEAYDAEIKASPEPTTEVFPNPTEVTLTWKEPTDKVYYTVNNADPKIVGEEYTKPITITQNTTIRAVAKNTEGDYSKVEIFKYKVQGGSGDEGDGDPNASWRVDVEQKVYTYTGSAIQPKVTVYGYDNETPLVEGVDYTVKYSNNVNASVKPDKNADSGYSIINAKKVPIITITGKGFITGKDTVEFEIRPKDISNEAIGDDESVAVADIIIESGKKATAPVICYNGVKLSAKDYDYANPADKNKPYTENGELVINGKGNFEGKLHVNVKVVAKGKLKDTVKKFKVTIDKEKVKNLVYTGKNLRGDIIDCISVEPANADCVITLPDEVINAGTVKFMVVGFGDYSGCSVSKSVKIQPKNITGSAAVAGPDKVVVGGVRKTDYVSTGAVLNDLTVTWTEEEPLENGKDYKLSYSGNKKADSKAKYTITFKGNFKGKVTGEFDVGKAALENDTEGIKVEIPDKVLKDNASCKSAPYVTINDVLVKSSEYEVTYSVGDNNGTYGANPKVNFKGADSETVYVKIKAKGKNYTTTAGNEVTGEYTVWNKANTKAIDLSKAKVTFYSDAGKKTKATKFEYDGGEIKPGSVMVAIGKGNDVKDYADKCEIIYVNNVNKGKATVIIKPKEDSGLIGGKTATFSIVARNIKTSQFKEVFNSVLSFFK
ncbi:MAG: chitobiase/beta-hexosaminidase C-terminal domain-containing protein [Lachnospiraceae bacterium]|nr:chitobiase/beta-hexosaminidase C-terminal domain-containing protein [Lachnospiraceae bacterium]